MKKMTREEIQSLVEHYANNAYVEHEDHTKCGQCWREKIKSEVANEFLKAGKLTQENLKEMFDEIDNRWRKTELYNRVKAMIAGGKTMEAIADELEAEGIEI